MQINIEKSLSVNTAIKDAVIAYQTIEPELELQENLKQELPNWDESDATSVIAIDTKDSLILDADEGILAQAKANVDISSERNVQIFSGRGFFANVLDKISLFAKAAGIKIKSGEGNIDISAQKGTMTLSSKQQMHVYALNVNDFVRIESGKGILLTSGGSYIKIQDGNIEMACPGLMELKAGQIKTMAGASLSTQ